MKTKIPVMRLGVVTYRRRGAEGSDPFVEVTAPFGGTAEGLAWMRGLVGELLAPGGAAEYVVAAEVHDRGGELVEALHNWEVAGRGRAPWEKKLRGRAGGKKA
jgi:hypothetical protein